MDRLNRTELSIPVGFSSEMGNSQTIATTDRDVKSRVRMKRRVAYNSMGEKYYEEYEIPNYDDMELIKKKRNTKNQSNKSLWSLSKLITKDKLPKSNKNTTNFVPALLKQLPEAILAYIPADTSLLSLWDASMNYWLQAAVTVRLCRYFLDLRTATQRKAFYTLKYQNRYNNNDHSKGPEDVDSSRDTDIVSSLSFHKMLMEYYTLRYGSESLHVVQHRVVVFLEALSQYCTSSSVVNILKHILIPDFSDIDEFTDLSIWLLIETRHELFVSGSVYEGEDIYRPVHGSGCKSSNRLSEKRHVISKYSAQTITIEILQNRGGYGPQFINYLMAAIETIPMAARPLSLHAIQLNQNNQHNDNSNSNSNSILPDPQESYSRKTKASIDAAIALVTESANKVTSAAEIFIDLDDFLLAFARTFVHAERLRLQCNNHLYTILESSSNKNNSGNSSVGQQKQPTLNLTFDRIESHFPTCTLSIGLLELLYGMVRADHYRSGRLLKPIFSSILRSYTPSTSIFSSHPSDAEVAVIVSAATTYLSSSAAVAALDTISYIDFFACLIAYVEQHRIPILNSNNSNDNSDDGNNDGNNNNNEGICNLTCEQMAQAIRENKIGIENTYIETLMNFISIAKASNIPSPLWMASDKIKYAYSNQSLSVPNTAYANKQRQHISREGNWNIDMYSTPSDIKGFDVNILLSDADGSNSNNKNSKNMNNKSKSMTSKIENSHLFSAYEDIYLVGQATGQKKNSDDFIQPKNTAIATMASHSMAFSTPIKDTMEYNNSNHSQMMDRNTGNYAYSVPYILPTLREIHTVHGEVSRLSYISNSNSNIHSNNSTASIDTIFCPYSDTKVRAILSTPHIDLDNHNHSHNNSLYFPNDSYLSSSNNNNSNNSRNSLSNPISPYHYYNDNGRKDTLDQNKSLVAMNQSYSSIDSIGIPYRNSYSRTLESLDVESAVNYVNNYNPNHTTREGDIYIYRGYQSPLATHREMDKNDQGNYSNYSYNDSNDSNIIDIQREVEESDRLMFANNSSDHNSHHENNHHQTAVTSTSWNEFVDKVESKSITMNRIESVSMTVMTDSIMSAYTMNPNINNSTMDVITIPIKETTEIENPVISSDDIMNFKSDSKVTYHTIPELLPTITSSIPITDSPSKEEFITTKANLSTPKNTFEAIDKSNTNTMMLSHGGSKSVRTTSNPGSRPGSGSGGIGNMTSRPNTSRSKGSNMNPYVQEAVKSQLDSYNSTEIASRNEMKAYAEAMKQKIKANTIQKIQEVQNTLSPRNITPTHAIQSKLAYTNLSKNKPKNINSKNISKKNIDSSKSKEIDQNREINNIIPSSITLSSTNDLSNSFDQNKKVETSGIIEPLTHPMSKILSSVESIHSMDTSTPSSSALSNDSNNLTKSTKLVVSSRKSSTKSSSALSNSSHNKNDSKNTNKSKSKNRKHRKHKNRLKGKDVYGNSSNNSVSDTNSNSSYDSYSHYSYSYSESDEDGISNIDNDEGGLDRLESLISNSIEEEGGGGEDDNNSRNYYYHDQDKDEEIFKDDENDENDENDDENDDSNMSTSILFNNIQKETKERRGMCEEDDDVGSEYTFSEEQPIAYLIQSIDYSDVNNNYKNSDSKSQSNPLNKNENDSQHESDPIYKAKLHDNNFNINFLFSPSIAFTAFNSDSDYSYRMISSSRSNNLSGSNGQNREDTMDQSKYGPYIDMIPKDEDFADIIDRIQKYKKYKRLHRGKALYDLNILSFDQLMENNDMNNNDDTDYSIVSPISGTSTERESIIGVGVGMDSSGGCNKISGRKRRSSLNKNNRVYDIIPIYQKDYIQWKEYFRREKDYLLQSLHDVIANNTIKPIDNSKNSSLLEEISSVDKLSTQPVVENRKKSKDVTNDVKEEMDRMKATNRRKSTIATVNSMLGITDSINHLNYLSNVKSDQDGIIQGKGEKKKNSIKALVRGRVNEYTLSFSQDSHHIFQISIEERPCVVTIEIQCLENSVQFLCSESIIPSTDQYDHNNSIHRISALDIHPTQLIFRPKYKNSTVMYFMIKGIDFKDKHQSYNSSDTSDSTNGAQSVNNSLTRYRIWGYSSSPSVKYCGDPKIDRMITLFEEFINPIHDSHHQNNNSNHSDTNINTNTNTNTTTEDVNNSSFLPILLPPPIKQTHDSIPSPNTSLLKSPTKLPTIRRCSQIGSISTSLSLVSSNTSNKISPIKGSTFNSLGSSLATSSTTTTASTIGFHNVMTPKRLLNGLPSPTGNKTNKGIGSKIENENYYLIRNASILSPSTTSTSRRSSTLSSPTFSVYKEDDNDEEDEENDKFGYGYYDRINQKKKEEKELVEDIVVSMGRASLKDNLLVSNRGVKVNRNAHQQLFVNHQK